MKNLKAFKDIGLVFALLSSLLGSISTIIYKPMMQSGISPMCIGLVESITLIVILFIFIKIKAWKIKQKPQSLQASQATQANKISNINKKVIFWGALFQGIAVFSFYWALYYLEPVTFSFLALNQVGIAIVLGCIFLRERYSFMLWLFLFLALLGSMLLCYGDIQYNNYLGIAFTFSFCLFYSLWGFVLRRYPNDQSLSNMLYGYLVVFCLVLTSILIQGSISVAVFSLHNISVIALTAIVSTLLSLMLFRKALQTEKLSLVSSIRLFSPYFVTLYFICFGGYQLKMMNIYGVVLMTLALVFFIIAKQRSQA